jgi:CubicO group peptidase (beta-lactamase class C family)
MQQMIIDVTGKTFPQYMQEAVLYPLHMTNSTYQPPPHPPVAFAAATGYYADGKVVKGGWHIYPEMAAAGLWTTASDLATFLIGLQQALAGTAEPVISRAMARQMITEQRDNDGLGLFLAGKGKTLRFSHNGRDDGFDAGMVGYVETGQGAVLLINANDASGGLFQLFEAIARTYNWPDYP